MITHALESPKAARANQQLCFCICSVGGRNRSMARRATNLAAAIFLSLQLWLVVHAQFTSRRYFCWAPNDYANTYSLSVKIKGEELTPYPALARYHLQDHRASYENPATHIMD